MRDASASCTLTTLRKSRGSLFILLCFVILLPITITASESLDFKIIKKLMKEGAYATALDQGEAYLSTYKTASHRPRVAAWVGRLLVKNGRTEEALPVLREAIEGLAPKKRGNLQLLEARVLLLLNKPAEAAVSLKGFEPGSPGARLETIRLKARIYRKEGKPGRVAEVLSTLAEEKRTAKDRLMLGMALARTGKDAMAVKALSSCLEKGAITGEGAGSARLALASSLYHMKEYNRASSALVPLLNAHKKDVEAFLLKAWILHAEGRNAEAYDLVRKTVPIDGWREAAALVPVRMAAVRGNNDAVISTAAKVLKGFPKGKAAAQARLLAAEALARRGDAFTALRVLEAAVPSLAPGSRRVKASLFGARLAWTKLRDKALSRRWLSVAEKDGTTVEEKALCAYNRANLNWAWGDSSAALKTLAHLVTTYKGTAAIPDAYLLLGHILMATGNTSKGSEALRVVVDSFPDSRLYPEAVLALAEGLAAQGKTGAIEPLLALLNDRPLSPTENLRYERLKGRFALLRQEWASAAEEFALCSTPGPGRHLSDAAFFGTALAYLGAGVPEEALIEAKSIQNPLLAKAVAFRAARLFMKQGQANKGLYLLEGLAKNVGSTADDALWLLAEERLKRKEMVPALATLQRLAVEDRYDPLSTLAQRRIEMLLLTKDGPKAALLAIPVFRESKPMTLGEADEMLRSARLKVRTGKKAEAEKIYSAYLERLPKGPGAGEAASYLATRALKAKDYVAARRVLERVKRTALMDLYLGEACYALKDPAASQAAFERALAASKALSMKEKLKAELLAGKAARMQGKTGEAISHLEAYAKAAPADRADRETLFATALWLQNRGRYDVALAALAKLRRSFRDAAVGYNYGYTLELMGRREKALKAYLRVAYASSNPQWALTARYRAAEIMLALGRRADAIALYRELAARAKGSVQGDFAARRLHQLQRIEAKEQSKRGQGGQKP